MSDSYTVEFNDGSLTVRLGGGTAFTPKQIRGLALDLLSHQDYEVVPAKDLEDALEKLQLSKEYVAHLKLQVESLQETNLQFETQIKNQEGRLEVVHEKLDKADARATANVLRFQAAEKRLAVIKEVIDL